MKIFFFVISLSLILFTSCQQEIDPNILNSPQNDSTTLSRIVALDTSLPSGQDTIAVLTFTYDGLKRRNIDTYREKDFTTGLYDTYWIYYYYNGTDTLPARFTEKFDYTTDTIIHYLSYSNGFATKDSLVNLYGPTPSYVYITYYSSLGGNLFLKKQVDFDWTSGATLTLDSTTYTRSVVNGNLMNAIDSVWLAGTPTLIEVTGKQFTFDNKPNPLSRTTVWYNGYYDNLDAHDDVDVGKNNATSARYDDLFPVPGTYMESYNYTYNTAGYPLIVRSNSGNTFKILFFYTRL